MTTATQTQFSPELEDLLGRMTHEDAQEHLDREPPELMEYIAMCEQLLNGESLGDDYVHDVRKAADVSAEQFRSDLEHARNRATDRRKIQLTKESIDGPQRELQERLKSLNAEEKQALQDVRQRFAEQRQAMTARLRQEQEGLTDRAGLRQLTESLTSGSRNPVVLGYERRFKSEARQEALRLREQQNLRDQHLNARPPADDPLRQRQAALAAELEVLQKSDPRVDQLKAQLHAVNSQVRNWQHPLVEQYRAEKDAYDEWRLAETNRIKQMKLESVI